MTNTKAGEDLAIGSDHAGLPAKERLKQWLATQGKSTKDFGVFTEESSDYPDVAHAVAKAVAKGHVARGILLCGTGLGMSYTANREPGVRAALCWSTEVARLSRDHNDANILVLPGRLETMDPLEEILAAWLETPFSGGERHCRRIGKIDAAC